MVKTKYSAVYIPIFFYCILISGLYAIDRKEREEPFITYEAAMGENMGKFFVLSESKAALEPAYSFSDLEINEISDYIFKKEYGIPYIFDTTGKKIFLILRNNEVCFIFKNNFGSQHLGAGFHIFAGVKQSLWENYILTDIVHIETTSFLKEEATPTRPRMSYEGENLARFSLDAPWVENVSGQGIGEKIRFSTYDEQEGGFPYKKAVGLYVCNGFISFVRPDLYEKNSRVKEFKVTDIKTQKSKSVYLEDTPNPQLIDISEFEGTDVELEIKDVYPGTRWQDTCVAGIILKRLRK